MNKHSNIGTFLAIILDEIYERHGNLKKQYIALMENKDFDMIEKKLCTLHASFHCDVVGINNYKMNLKELREEMQK